MGGGDRSMGGLSGFFENFGDNLDELGSRMPSILDGIWVTVQLTVLGALCAMLIALVFGLLQTVKFAVLRVIARIFVEFFRGTSLLVQLFWLFYVLPLLGRSEEHTSELQSRGHLVCRLLLEKKKLHQRRRSHLEQHLPT